MQEHARICENGCIKNGAREFLNNAFFSYGKLKTLVNTASRIEEFEKSIDWSSFLRFIHSLK